MAMRAYDQEVVANLIKEKEAFMQREYDLVLDQEYVKYLGNRDFFEKVLKKPVSINKFEIDPFYHTNGWESYIHTYTNRRKRISKLASLTFNRFVENGIVYLTDSDWALIKPRTMRV